MGMLLNLAGRSAFPRYYLTAALCFVLSRVTVSVALSKCLDVFRALVRCLTCLKAFCKISSLLKMFISQECWCRQAKQRLNPKLKQNNCSICYAHNNSCVSFASGNQSRVCAEFHIDTWKHCHLLILYWEQLPKDHFTSPRTNCIQLPISPVLEVMGTSYADHMVSSRCFFEACLI